MSEPIPTLEQQMQEFEKLLFKADFHCSNAKSIDSNNQNPYRDILTRRLFSFFKILKGYV